MTTNTPEVIKSLYQEKRDIYEELEELREIDVAEGLNEAQSRRWDDLQGKFRHVTERIDGLEEREKSFAAIDPEKARDALRKDGVFTAGQWSDGAKPFPSMVRGCVTAAGKESIRENFIAARDAGKVSDHGPAAPGDLWGLEEELELRFLLARGEIEAARKLVGDSAAEARGLTTDPASAGATVPAIVAMEWIDVLRARDVTDRLGARTVGLGSAEHRFARVTSDPTGLWRDELVTIPESDPGIDAVVFLPKTYGLLVILSEEVAADSVNIVQLVRDILARNVGSERERVALVGAGGTEPTGLYGQVGQTAATAGQETWTQIMEGRAALVGANVDPERIQGLAMAPADYLTLWTKDVTTADQQYLRAPSPIAAREDGGPYDYLDTPNITTQGPAIGDWGDLWKGDRLRLDIQISREPVFAEYGWAVRAVMRNDVQVARAASFTEITGFGG